MDGLTLIRAARALGLSVLADGDTLVVRGPKHASNVACCLTGNKSAVMTALTSAAAGGLSLEWTREAREIFLERLAIGADMGMDVSVGSDAWNIAVREASRVHAGIPPDVDSSRDSSLLDDVLAAFGPVGGLRFVSAERREPTATVPPSPVEEP